MTTALEGGEGSASHPSCSLPPGKTQYPLYGRLGGPQGWSGQVPKISPPPELNPRSLQPIASCYTGYSTCPTIIPKGIRFSPSYICPDWHWRPPSLCYNRYLGSILGVKPSWHGTYHLLPPSTKIEST
jgi:hypothetical protein